MDFSSLNPNTSNCLNIAARTNDIPTVRRLLKKLNPNCVDNRGWTCLHEAAANDSYQSLKLILKHTDCRPLAQTHEGHTALYLACRYQSSIQTIRALLESEEDIVNYGSTECVTPLHLVSSQGRLEAIQILIDYGAILDVQDFDGDTPLHEAITSLEATNMLLHAGADSEIKNYTGCSPFHMACYKGGIDTVTQLFLFLTDINDVTCEGDSPLIFAAESCNNDIVQFLLQNGADPHIKNKSGSSALDVALYNGENSIFKTILDVTDKDKINPLILLFACKPHYFQLEILKTLLYHDLGPEFFDFIEPFHITMEKIGGIRPEYHTNSPLNSFLNICEYIYRLWIDSFSEIFYLFLMRGVAVDALNQSECPPLVYIHYCAHSTCFSDVLKILVDHGCNVDYCSASVKSQYDEQHTSYIPDAFIASLTSDPSTTPIMMPYSLQCEPDLFLKFAYDAGILGRIKTHTQAQLLSMIGLPETTAVESLQNNVLPLKHLCRLKIRYLLKRNELKSTTQFLRILNCLKMPQAIVNYLRYL